MSQHSFSNETIQNQSASNARTDINGALEALVTLSSGTGSPPTPLANMLWCDTNAGGGADGILKIRNNGNTAWINVAYLDQAGNLFKIIDNTEVVSTSGATRGLLGDQATSTWQAGTGTTESLVSPAKVKAAILALSYSPDPDFTTQTSFANNVTSVSHGLGALPSRWEVNIVCTSANLGYAVGDVIRITSHNEGSGLRGTTVSANATQITVAGYSVFLQPKTATGVTALTNSKWNLIFQAWE